MEINELARKTYEFHKFRMGELGSELTPELMFTHLVEEVGEIARQMFNRSISMRKYEEDNIREEISQSMLDIMTLSQLFGMDLEGELTRKLDDLMERRNK